MDIVINNLPVKYKEADLKALFEQFGAVVEVKLPVSNITRLNKGFGFAKMSNDEEANKAIEELNAKEIDGKVVSVGKVEGSIDAMTTKLLRLGTNAGKVSSNNKGVNAPKGGKSFGSGNSGGRSGKTLMPKGGSNRGS
jgi:RNA recognition motif-containing protein